MVSLGAGEIWAWKSAVCKVVISGCALSQTRPITSDYHSFDGTMEGNCVGWGGMPG
jgi:hypothetical protein